MDSRTPRAGGSLPPALPPRGDNASSRSLSPPGEAPPPYEAAINSTTRDPRTSSQQSMRPSSDEEQDGRRKLLMIYIHGFMGNETSFRSFPAHVHQLLRVLLSDTHIVHTKIYPRYRSRKHISVARDDFSKWLEPHESPQTDVVLLGHSMGGLVAAEVAIVPASALANRPLKHRILGTINFDVPFLGMHPGIIKSGLASIFMPSEDTHQDKYADGGPGANAASTPPDRRPSSPTATDDLFTPQHNDPNFNPSFTNDVMLPVRKGWSNAWHFINKHSKDLRNATKQLVSSHLEFGGAMANYPELKARYGKLRILEEQNEQVRTSVYPGCAEMPRIRFVNYYTASTGKIKHTNDQPSLAQEQRSVMSSSSLQLHPANEKSHSRDSSQSSLIRTPSPAITIEEHGEYGIIPREPPSFDALSSGSADWERAVENLSGVLERDRAENAPEVHDGGQVDEPRAESVLDARAATSSDCNQTVSSEPKLLPLPPAPSMPDVSDIHDPKALKAILCKHEHALKVWERALHDRERLLRKQGRIEHKLDRKIKRVNEKTERTEKLQQHRARAAEKLARAQGRAQARREKLNAKVEKLERKGKQRELSHNEQEEIRLEKERQRVAAEGRRLRGEPEPVLPAELPASDVVTESNASDAVLTPPSSPNLLSEDDSSSLDGTSSIQPVPSQGHGSIEAEKEEKQKKPAKDRKFCVLPPKDSAGVRDPCWVRVFMQGVDEVGAHCGLFFVDERYERTVGDVAERVEHWVKDENDARLVASLHETRLK